jgi:hypothetical protein
VLSWLWVLWVLWPQSLWLWWGLQATCRSCNKQQILKIMMLRSQLWKIFINAQSATGCDVYCAFAAGCLNDGWCSLSFENDDAFTMGLVLLLLWQEQYYATSGKKLYIYIWIVYMCIR